MVNPRACRGAAAFRYPTLARDGPTLSPPLPDSSIQHHALFEIFCESQKYLHRAAAHNDDVIRESWSVVRGPAAFGHIILPCAIHQNNRDRDRSHVPI